MDNRSIKKLEADFQSVLHASTRFAFLRYAYSRFKMVEEILKNRPVRNGRQMPVEAKNFADDLLGELLRIFNNNALDEVGGDVIGRIYEYFLNKFVKNIASDDGVFFTPKPLVKMIVNILESISGVLLDPVCGSGGMFVQAGDFVNEAGLQANSSMTFYGQEKVEYNAQLCLMNMSVQGLTGVIKSGDEANSFYHDAHNLEELLSLRVDSML